MISHLIKKTITNAHFLKSNYYYINGEKDFLANSLNCFEQGVYFILKNKVNNMFLPFFFIDDISLFLTKTNNNNGILNFHVNRINKELNYKIFEWTNTISPIDFIYDTLKKGEMLIVGTIAQKLPYLKEYDPSLKLTSLPPIHHFLIIACNQYELYFVDGEDLINYSKFVSYKSNPEIGIINTKVVNEAFMLQFIAYTIDINSEIKINSELILSNVIKSIINNYYCENDKILLGRCAFEYLIYLCDNKLINMQSINDIYKINFYKLFDWRLWNLCLRRRLLKICLENYSTSNNKDIVNNLNKLLDNSLNQLEKIKLLLAKKFYSKNYILDPNCAKQFKKLLENEDNMINNFSNIFK